MPPFIPWDNEAITVRAEGGKPRTLIDTYNVGMQATRPTVVLVACAAAKRAHAAPAKDLYVSALFQKSRAYAELNADHWYILSAKHGLVRPDEVIKPYNLTLNQMGIVDRRRWADRVNGQLDTVIPTGSTLIFLAGARYREGLEPVQRHRGVTVTVPMEGMRIGEQLQWLSR